MMSFDDLQQLDLSYIQKFMCSDRYPLPRWEEGDARQCALLYKRFFYLLCKYRGEWLVPTKAIDEFWHNHILYTDRYVKDCERLAGRYLHHYPSDPDLDDPSELIEGFKRTQALYLEEFGEPLQVYVID